MSSSAAAALPRSVARWYDPLLTVGASLTLFFILRDTTISDVNMVLALVAGSTFFMLLCEWLRRRQSLPPLTPMAFATLTQRVAIKWLGVMITLYATFFLWWFIPFYQAPRYDVLFTLQPVLVPWFAALLIPYLYITEWRLGEAKDYAWVLGRLALGNVKDTDWRIVRDAMLSVLVRTIFLPLNFCFMTESMDGLRTANWALMFGEPTPESHFLIMRALYALLIVAIIPGYIFTFRLLNTYSRAIDRSWMGWVVCLICYPPLISGAWSGWFAYNPYRFEEPFMKPWIHLFEDNLSLVYAIGIGIILSEVVHLWGEAIIGIRSSNLTHRGIITNGCFRLTRHPVYFSKCVGWFLIACPFMMSPTTLECLRACGLFGVVCLIYYLRGITEERMLSVDPDYVTYALWMDKHGFWPKLNQWFPVLSFAWRHEHWHKKAPASTLRVY